MKIVVCPNTKLVRIDLNAEFPCTGYVGHMSWPVAEDRFGASFINGWCFAYTNNRLFSASTREVR